MTDPNPNNEHTVELTRGDEVYELTISSDHNNWVIEQVVKVGTEEDIDTTLFEETVTEDEWIAIGEQYRSQL